MSSPSPLRPARPAARRRGRPQDGPAAPRAPPAARQRLVHPPAPARLRLRVHLRNLHPLPDQHRVPPRPASPAQPRRSPTTKTVARSSSASSSTKSTTTKHH